ncbi:hypothetical protein DM02DRAFT_692566 [Periconia macrospinosa]|uniref:Uncharacterized protein n=1 Tax=Periconia macrospinosa TaxID=97972 RepID=A0A2V1D987_9PLEO|nr:hypothetical protein DM02DRAFT_692566 [Periconia macrospinosa]
MAQKHRSDSAAAEDEMSRKKLNSSPDDDQDLSTHGDQETSADVDRKIGAEAKPTFLTLPGEIRNTIYDYVFGGEDWTVSYVGWDFKASKSFEHPLALLQTCRQVHTEACKLPFTLGAFSFDQYSPANVPKGLSLVETIIMRGTCGPTFDWMSLNDRGWHLLSDFPSLKNIHIFLNDGMDYRNKHKWAISAMIEYLNWQARDKNWSLTIIYKDQTFSIKNNTAEICRQFLPGHPDNDL